MHECLRDVRVCCNAVEERQLDIPLITYLKLNSYLKENTTRLDYQDNLVFAVKEVKLIFILITIRNA
jgi:hypothetical protein